MKDDEYNRRLFWNKIHHYWSLPGHRLLYDLSQDKYLLITRPFIKFHVWNQLGLVIAGCLITSLILSSRTLANTLPATDSSVIPLQLLSPFFEDVCVPLRLMNWLFLVPNSQPTAIELFQSPLYISGTVFRSISHLLRHFLSSALTWRHTSSNSCYP